MIVEMLNIMVRVIRFTVKAKDKKEKPKKSKKKLQKKKIASDRPENY